MLKDGRFYKEELPKIGKFYTPTKDDKCTPEERFMQDIILGYKEQENSFLSKMLGYMLRI